MAVKLVSLYLLALLGTGLAQDYFGRLTPQSPQKPHKPPGPQQPQHPRPPRPQIPTTPQETSPPDFNSCDVPPHHKIQCGLPGISLSDCENINCCFDGHMCYYGKAVTLQCTKDGQFIVVIARDATLPHIDLESIHFNGMDQNCQPVGTTMAFAIYQFSVTQCGTVTTMEGENNVISYENRISGSYEVAVGPYGAITRDSQFDLMVQCRYIGTSVDALVVEVAVLNPPPPVAAAGPVRVELRLGNGQCMSKGCIEEDVAYTSYYQESDYPVTKVLRDPVYVEVRLLEKTDPNLVLTLGRCWATSSPNPMSYPQWDLLVDGCPYREDRYTTSLVRVDIPGFPFPSHYKRFIFKMFTFVSSGSGGGSQKNQQDTLLTPLQEMIYIHCTTAVCQQSMHDNCEPRCFRRRRDVGAGLMIKSRADAPIVTSPGIIYKRANDDSQ